MIHLLLTSDQQKLSSKQIPIKRADYIVSSPKPKDDLYISWSELGGAIAVAVTKPNSGLELTEYEYKAKKETEEAKHSLQNNGKQVPFPSSKTGARKIESGDFLDSDDEFRRRMIRRTLRTRSSLLNFSQSIINETILENQESNTINESTKAHHVTFVRGHGNAHSALTSTNLGG